MAKQKLFRSGPTLSQAVNNNAALLQMLLTWGRATARFNRLLLVWVVVATLAIIWLAVTR